MSRTRANTRRGKRGESAAIERDTDRLEERMETIAQILSEGCPHCGDPESPPISAQCETCGFHEDDILDYLE
jgi:hypothetical protein